MEIDSEAIYKHIKRTPTKFNEEIHCPLVLKIMSNPRKATMSAFCVEAIIGEGTFWKWLKIHEIFLECYTLGKMYARENWEDEGREIAREVNGIGESNHRFEHWRLTGWSRFGVGKNSRIRLNLDAKLTPDKHYTQLLEQASNGDFTAGEIKQLMEAINVGLNSHQVIKLQKEIDQLKSDLVTMTENTNGHNTIADKRVTKKN